MAPFYGWGSAISRLQSHYKEADYFLQQVPRNSWYSFDQPWKDKRLGRLWSHPVVLNAGPLDWESSTLTTRPLFLRLLCSLTVNQHVIWQFLRLL